ncbi:MAG: polysaccharide pyruvyl transferase family protein [Cyanobacteria bacterium P01_A01_bin.40]
MFYEVQGVEFVNKGAELMLYAMVQHLQQYDPTAVVAANLERRYRDRQSRAKVGLEYVTWVDNRWHNSGSIINGLASLLPSTARRHFQLVLNQEVDVLLDASGFSYTDQWGAGYAQRMAAKLARLKAEGKKVILLPQAFGPFENTQVKAAFETILVNSDLVFARDQVSFDFVQQFEAAAGKLNLAPDFTNLVSGRVPDYFTADNRSCIIPNVRMLDKTEPQVREKYLTFIENCIQCLLDLELSPFIMVHQTGKDYEIALNLQSKFGDRLTVIAETDPLAIKGILGQCFLVISSRFHGIVSSLSQGVPCLATGWSHKYQMLFEDYRCPQLLMNPLFTPAEITAKIEAVTREPSRSQIVNTIQTAALEQKKLSQQMWQQVHQMIGLTSSAIS